MNVETLKEFSERTPQGRDQRIVLRFLTSPVEIKGDGKVESIVIGKNELVEEDGRLVAHGWSLLEEQPDRYGVVLPTHRDPWRVPDGWALLKAERELA